MTHHNITHSEAGRPIAHVQIRTMPGRRRRARFAGLLQALGNSVVFWHVVAFLVAVADGLIDTLVLKAPVCFFLIGVPFLAWCFMPSRT